MTTEHLHRQLHAHFFAAIPRVGCRQKSMVSYEMLGRSVVRAELGWKPQHPEILQIIDTAPRWQVDHPRS